MARRSAPWVCLLLAVAAFLATPTPAWATGVLADSYPQTDSFTDALPGTTMTAAYDGTYYWTSSGGGPSGPRLAQHDGSGALVSTYAPGLDLRSVFTIGDVAPVFARAYNDDTIYVQTAFGTFIPYLTLTSGSPDAQSDVVATPDGRELIASLDGTIQRWDAGTGAFLGTVTLSGYGSMFTEGDYPADRMIAAANGYYLTYSLGHLSVWDAGGNRVGTTELLGAGTGFDSQFSACFANGRVWVVDVAGGTWRGYRIDALNTCARLVVRGFGDPRTFSGYNIYSPTSTAGQELLDPLNWPGFGVSVVVRAPAIQTATAYDLAGVRLFFTGLIGGPNVSASEVSDLTAFVNAGGWIVANGDNTLFSAQIDPLLNAFGLATASPNQVSPDQLTILQPTHPVMNGPFGMVTDLQSQDAAALQPPTLDAVILAQHADGRGAIAAVDPAPGRAGGFLFFPDSENNLIAFGTRGPLPPDQSRIAFLNAVADTANGMGDTVPPTVSSSVTRRLLWPPSLGLIPVGLSASVTDNTDPSPLLTVDVWSDEPVGAVAPDADDTPTLRLRAERQYPGDGRVYLIVARGVDACGNESTSTQTVVVPSTLSLTSIMQAYAQAAAAQTTFAGTGAPPVGWTKIYSTQLSP